VKSRGFEGRGGGEGKGEIGGFKNKKKKIRRGKLIGGLRGIQPKNQFGLIQGGKGLYKRREDHGGEGSGVKVSDPREDERGKSIINAKGKGR